jgi:hypothetical protein
MWSEEEVRKAADVRDRACERADVDVMAHIGVAAIMSYAVELAAARGGTMTAESLSMALVDVERNLAATGPRIREHISAQGARVAALEQEKRNLEGGNRLLAERLHGAEESVRELTRRAQLAEAERDSVTKARDYWRNKAATLSTGQVLSAHASKTCPTCTDSECAVHPTSQWGEKNAGNRPDMSQPCRHNGRWHAPIGGTGFNCSDCGERIPVWMAERLAQQVNTGTYPCSPTCTHDDARTTGHPERVKERSESFAHGALGLPTPEERREAMSIATTEEDVDLEFVEEALTEESDSKVSNGALYWRRRFLKLAARLGWMDVETMSRRKDEARDEGAEATRAACWGAVQPLLQRMGIDHITQYEFKSAIEGATP